MKKCNHLVGYYLEEINDSEEMDLVYFEFLNLEYLSNVKASGLLFNFCPNCGESLIDIVKTKEENLKKELEKEKEIRLKEKKEKEILFLNQVKELSKETKLDQLPESGNFIVVLMRYGKTNYGPKNAADQIILKGNKDLILRNCLNVLKNGSTNKLSVVTVYKVPEEPIINDLLVSNGWEVFKSTGPIDAYYKKKDKNKEITLSLDHAGTVYLTIKEDGYSSYDQFGLHLIGEYLKTDFQLEAIILK